MTFRLNVLLRSPAGTSPKTVVLRPRRKAAYSFENTRQIPASDLDLAVEQVGALVADCHNRVTELTRKEEGSIASKNQFIELASGQEGPEEPSSPSESTGKRVPLPKTISLTEIQKEEKLGKDLEAARAELAQWRRAGSLLAMVRSKTPLAERELGLFRLPKVLTSEPCIRIFVDTTRVADPSLVTYLRTYVVTNKVTKAGDLTLVAPLPSLSPEGVIQPLPKDMEQALLLFQDRGAKAKRPSDEALAWKWLIISHNSAARGKNRVPLHRRLAVHYSRNAESSTRRLTDVQAQNKILLELVETLRIQLGNTPGVARVRAVSAGASPERADAIQRLVQSSLPAPPDIPEELESSSDGSSEHGDPVGPPQSADPPQIRWWQDGLWFMQSVNELADVQEGHWAAVARIDGALYRKIEPVDAASLGVPIPGRPDTAKGKTGGGPPVPPASKRALARDHSQARRSPKPVSPPVDPLATKNPLRVSGVKRTDMLTSAQNESLRKFFKCPSSAIDPTIWATMSKPDKAAARSARSIPRWAVSAVVEDASNLAAVLKGDLTKENRPSASRRLTPGVPSSVNQATASAAWKELKARHAGVRLMVRPTNSKEKAFKGSFDGLVKRFGPQPCFPKPAKGGNSQDKPRGSGGGRSRDLEAFISTLKLVKDVFK
jgi:hypothetical protein